MLVESSPCQPNVSGGIWDTAYTQVVSHTNIISQYHARSLVCNQIQQIVFYYHARVAAWLRVQALRSSCFVTPQPTFRTSKIKSFNLITKLSLEHRPIYIFKKYRSNRISRLSGQGYVMVTAAKTNGYCNGRTVARSPNSHPRDRQTVWLTDAYAKESLIATGRTLCIQCGLNIKRG